MGSLKMAVITRAYIKMKLIISEEKLQLNSHNDSKPNSGCITKQKLLYSMQSHSVRVSNSNKNK